MQRGQIQGSCWSVKFLLIQLPQTCVEAAASSIAENTALANSLGLKIKVQGGILNVSYFTVWFTM